MFISLYRRVVYSVYYYINKVYNDFMDSEKDIKIKTILDKGVSEILPSKDFVKSKLNSGNKLSIYAGFDPTGPTLHLGHAISLRKLRQFQDLGHQIIFLVGNFTAQIGDPTDKGSARKVLTKKEVEQNLKLYKKQASKFISFSGKNKALIKYNNDWLGKMRFADVLNLASNMTVDQMLKRDMFDKRIKEQKPIYIHEFMYPLMQGYDSVYLNVDGEVGGNDQLFNMMTGRQLQKTLKNKEKFVITTKLLEDNSGKKMGKTEGNMVSFLDAPEDIYGKVMSWTDGMIVPAFELCTNYSLDEVKNISDRLEKNENPRDIKMLLAFEIVKEFFGEKESLKAQEIFIKTFQKKEIHDDIREVLSKDRTLENILLEENIISSKSEIRRLAQSGAISDFENKKTLSYEDVKTNTDKRVFKIGKKNIIRVV